MIKAMKSISLAGPDVEKLISNLVVEYNLPRYVVLGRGDNELLLDLNNSICRSILAKELSKSDVFLFENLFSSNNCFIKQDGKSYTNEINIPLTTSKPYYRRSYSWDTSQPGTDIRRIFPPGSEWLYLKIYTGCKLAEKALTEVIGDFASELMNTGTIDSWFFIKYNDPDYHLRVRFHRKDKEKNEQWLSLVENLDTKLRSLIAEKYAFRITMDTYIREVERYGVETMEISERVFCADSIAITEFLSLISGTEGEVLRWKFAFISIDDLLNDFGYTTHAKKQLLEELSNNFLAEFSFNKRSDALTLIKAINNKYRKLRNEIADVIENNQSADLEEAYDCFRRRSHRIKQEAELIRTRHGHAVHDLMQSYIHMSLNRLFLVNQQRHELVIYYFLTKYYESVIVKSKNLAV
jgi:thiopeptide-type bacteriocin biosynthesis protein